MLSSFIDISYAHLHKISIQMNPIIFLNYKSFVYLFPTLCDSMYIFMLNVILKKERKSR